MDEQVRQVFEFFQGAKQAHPEDLENVEIEYTKDIGYHLSNGVLLGKTLQAAIDEIDTRYLTHQEVLEPPYYGAFEYEGKEDPRNNPTPLLASTIRTLWEEKRRERE